jgi:ribosomal protein S18 acetylase RimI-like enzyme
MNCHLSEFTPADAEAINQIAIAAFAQYQHAYEDWAVFSSRIGNMAALAESAELIVARVDGRIAGAVAYMGPGKEKAPFFSREWPILRMLVVEPHFRGRGIGHALTQECIRRAVRDNAPLIALHTSHIMKVALSMYERMGFRFAREAPTICGVPYGVYVLKLHEDKPDQATERGL